MSDAEDNMDTSDNHTTSTTSTTTVTTDEGSNSTSGEVTGDGGAAHPPDNTTAAITRSDTDGAAFDNEVLAGMGKEDPETAMSDAAPAPPVVPPPTTPTHRLLITKIVMENFKSYGGVREIGPFHKCFSSIVGPNGSGKSNVIDAMLFVFGEKAAKLRQKRVSELIHRSDTFPNLAFTRVSVHFVDILDVEGSEDEYTEVPGTRLVVTRTAQSDNTSKYTLDGKNATWAQVKVLLLKRGVDLEHNRFLILQGEVEQIAMMKAKAQTVHDTGLLEYLEEIIGSNRFVEDLEVASKRVEELNDQRAERLGRLKLAEKEKEGLEGDRKDAEDFLRLAATVRKKSNVLYQIHLANASTNIEKIAEKQREKKERHKYEKEKLKSTVAQVKEAKRKDDIIRGESEKLTATMMTVKEEYDEVERQDIQFQSNKKFMKDQIRKLEAAIKKDEKRSKDSLMRAGELEERLEALKQAVKQSEARKTSEDAALEEVNESLKGRTAELREELEREQEKAQPVREEADALKNKVETCKCEINLVRESTEKAKKRLSVAEEALSKLLAKAATDKTDLADAKKELAAMEQQIRSAEEKVEETKRELADKTEAMVKAVAAAEEARESRDSAANKTGALRAVLEAAAPGGPLEHAGVCGRLGDLGVIDAQYDVAVSSASGTLDHVVVETAEGAQACVEFLRTTNAGRLPFVILEKLDHLRTSYSQPFRGPAGCPRLFDLVQISDQKFRPAFYLALRDTLVAPDLDTAVANAYERGSQGRCLYKIVSKDGKLVDRSGTMTGGGNSTKRGGMRTTGGGRHGGAGARGAGAAPGAPGIVSAAQAEKLASLARKAQEDVREASAAVRAAQGQVKALHARGQKLQTQIPALETRLEGVGASEEQYRQQIQSLQGQCQLSPEAQAQLDALNKDLAKDERALAKVSKSLEEAEAAIQELQTAILEVGGERLKKAAKRADAAARALDEAIDAVNRATVDSKGERKKGEKLAKDAEKKKKDLETVTEKAKKAEEDFAPLDEKAYEVLTRYDAAREVVRVKNEELKGIAEEYEKAKALEDKIIEVLDDLSEQLAEYAEAIKMNDAQFKAWNSKLIELRLLHGKEAEEWGLKDDEEGDDEDDDQSGNASDGNDDGGGDNGMDVDDSDSNSEEGEEDGRADMEDTDAGMEEQKDGEAQNEKKEQQQLQKKREKKTRGSRKRSKADDAAEAKSNGKEAEKKSAARGPGWLPDLPREHLEDIDRVQLKLDIAEVESQMKKAEGNVNLSTLALYRAREKDYISRVAELEEATVARNEARSQHEDLRRQRLEEFMAGFGQITLRLKEMYQMITLGGDAELELVDSLDPFSEGIVFSVRPPKKSWKNIANLSGGEKTLSSLALVFALHHFKPTPLYVMDEIDAALDFKNVSIVANYIKERTKNAQFIIISLRNNMFELADRLVGIYKTHNVTKSVTINPKEFSATQAASKAKPTPKAAGILGDATNAMRTSEA